MVTSEALGEFESKVGPWFRANQGPFGVLIVADRIKGGIADSRFAKVASSQTDKFSNLISVIAVVTPMETVGQKLLGLALKMIKHISHKKVPDALFPRVGEACDYIAGQLPGTDVRGLRRGVDRILSDYPPHKAG
jgi:hypothetical protein